MVHGRWQMVKVFGLYIVVVSVLPRDSCRRHPGMAKYSLSCSTTVNNCMWMRMTLRRRTQQSWILLRIFVN
uniref:Putative secreted protein n=1 Tax=Nyssomyia neivai TaxID=330878 RepID=A0A1L8DNS0_9DIPT